MSDNIVQRSILSKPFHSCFRTNLFYARNVIHRVSDQGQIIEHASWRDAKLDKYGRFIECFVTHGIDQCHLRIHQLRNVFIAGRNYATHVFALGLFSQCTNHIICFHPFNDQHRPAHGVYALMQRRELRHQIVRHGRTMRFIFCIEIVTESLAFCIKYAGAIMSLVILVQTPQHVEHAINRASRFVFAVA